MFSHLCGFILAIVTVCSFSAFGADQTPFPQKQQYWVSFKYFENGKKITSPGIRVLVGEEAFVAQTDPATGDGITIQVLLHDTTNPKQVHAEVLLQRKINGTDITIQSDTIITSDKYYMLKENIKNNTRGSVLLMKIEEK